MEKLNQLLTNGSEIEDVLDFVFEGLSDLIPFERMGVGLLTEDHKISLYWVKATFLLKHLNKGFTATLTSTALADLIEIGRPRIIPDLAEYLKDHPNSRFTKLAIEDGIRSSLTYPLIVQGHTIGAVFFSSRIKNQFTLEHAEIFSAVAGEVAIVMERALAEKFFDNRRQ